MTKSPGPKPEPPEALGIPPDYGARRGLAPQAEARGLVRVGANPDGREVLLRPETAQAWERMREAAAASGIVLVAVSGFRSVARQEEIIRHKLGAGQAIEEVLCAMAAPGYSEHHTGRAVDIATPGVAPLTEEFEGSGAFRWLEAHGREYGFRLSYPRGNSHGIAYEPWHWFHRPS